jgi:hypothetical protein
MIFKEPKIGQLKKHPRDRDSVRSSEDDAPGLRWLAVGHLARRPQRHRRLGRRAAAAAASGAAGRRLLGVAVLLELGLFSSSSEPTLSTTGVKWALHSALATRTTSPTTVSFSPSTTIDFTPATRSQHNQTNAAILIHPTQPTLSKLL